MSLKTERLISKARKLAKNGKIEEAKETYFAVLKDNPSNLEAKNGLSLLKSNKAGHPKKNELQAIVNLYRSGMFDQAISDSNKLILKYENEPFLHNIKGASLSEIGDVKSSISSLEKAIELKPDYSEALFNLGVSLQKNGQLKKAAEVYQKAINSNHAYPAAHNNLGLILLGLDEINNAVKCFEWAIAYNPNYAEAHNSLGFAFKELQQFENAYEEFKKATKINSNYSVSYFNLGIVCEIINQTNEALNAYTKAISLNPDYFLAHRALSRIKKYKKNDPHIDQLHSLYTRDNISDSSRLSISFALAEVNKDLGNHREYFRFLNEANGLRKKELNYSFNDSKNFHSIIKKVFQQEQPKIPKELISDKKLRPIFIVGMPRSGTTLIEQILSSHQNVDAGGELLALRKIITPILDSHLSENNYSFQEKDFLSIREQYMNFLTELKPSKNIITDKMPMNFRLIGFILKAIPEAKIVHIKRDARATCWSNYKHFFGAGNGFSFNQEDIVKFFKLYCELTEFWHSKFPGKIYDISYEKLTINQKIETQKLLKYCNLDWDENCLNFHKNNRAIATSSKSQVRQKMYQGSSDAWKEYAKYLQPIIKGLEQF